MKKLFVMILAFGALFSAVATAHADSRLTTGSKTTWTLPNSAARVYTAPRWDARDGGRRLPTVTDNGAPNVVQVVKTHVDGLGDVWVQIRFAGSRLPLTRWVRRNAISEFKATRTRVVISRASSTLTVYKADTQVYSTRIGLGKSSTPTPKGSFWIKELFTSNAPYGPIAFGTSARPKGGYIPGLGNTVGIHGMAGLGSATGAVSNGCLRVSDIAALGTYIGLGVPVIIR